MKINDNNPPYRPSKLSHSFVLFGPFIATILAILYAHLIGFFITDHFGQNIHLRSIILMIVSLIPITLFAYIVGFIPAWITGMLFSDLINCKFLINIKSTTRFILIGGLAGTSWPIILGAMIATTTKAHFWWCFLVIGIVTIPTSIICSIIEIRIINSSIK